MKIAVYTIAKNEERFIKRWANSTEEADYRLILDTGSTDGSFEEYDNVFGWRESHSHIASHVFDPWRFDHARNHALSMLPADIDYCIALDMDEVLQPGWREALETFLTDNPTVNRPRYKYVWSWNEDGTEGLVYGGDKIHARHGYHWKHPVHEVITPFAGEAQGFVPGLEIHHHSDPTKSRSQYLPLLELAVREDPDNDRNQFYLGREYFYQGNTQLAAKHLTMAILLSKWPPERAAAYRILYKMNGDVGNLYKALQQDPTRKETLVALALHYHNEGNWVASGQFAGDAIAIREKPLDYLCEADAWGWLPFDLAAIACYHQGYMESAFIYGSQALGMNPSDERLRANMGFYESR